MHHHRRLGWLLPAIGVFTFSSLQAAVFMKATSTNGRMVDAVPQQVVVSYKEGHESKGKTAFKQFSSSLKKRNAIGSLGFEVLQVPTGETIDSFIQKLKADPNIETAEPNSIVHALSPPPNDPDFSAQNSYYLGTTAGIDILDAWDISQGTPSVIVAVVDSGIDLTHTDLAANLVPGVGATMFNDLNGDGDCLDLNEDCASSDPQDTFGHGTHVAGLIAAVTNNGQGMAGIARNSKMFAVRCLTANGSGSESAVADGITYAVDHGASVINLSLGNDSKSSLIEAAVNYAFSHNVVVVAAAGNDAGPVNYPGAYDRVIAVGAITSTNTIADFSSRGAGIDVVAPGVGILSTVNGGGTSAQFHGFSADGTSFASPMVAGVAALLRSINPTMSVADVTRYIDFYADDLGPTGYETTYGYGRVNAYRSLQAASVNAPFISNPVYPNDTFPYPNPFNPTTGYPVVISLPESLGSQSIKITIFNIAGQPIKVLNDTNEWNGRNDDGNYVASGLYYYFAETSKGHVKGKLTVIK